VQQWTADEVTNGHQRLRGDSGQAGHRLTFSLITGLRTLDLGRPRSTAGLAHRPGDGERALGDAGADLTAGHVDAVVRA
jgi:hypothetical protein